MPIDNFRQSLGQLLEQAQQDLSDEQLADLGAAIEDERGAGGRAAPSQEGGRSAELARKIAAELDAAAGELTDDQLAELHQLVRDALPDQSA